MVFLTVFGVIAVHEGLHLLSLLLIKEPDESPEVRVLSELLNSILFAVSGHAAFKILITWV